MADNAKFVIEFQAQMKELRAALAEIRKFQKEQKGQAKFDKKVMTDDHKQKLRFLDKERKEMRRDRKDEQDHNTKLFKQFAKKGGQDKKERDARKKERNQEKQHVAEQGRDWKKVAGVFAAYKIGAGLLGAAYNFVVGGSQAAYQKHAQFQQTMGRTQGMFSGGAGAVNQGLANVANGRYGFSKQESLEQSGLMGRATGVAGPRELQEAMRSTGMEAGETAQFFNTLRKGGATFTGGGGESGAATGSSAGAKQFKDMLAAGMASGIEKARLPEFLAGIQDLTEQAQSMAGDAVDPTNIAKVAAILGRSDASGLQGARGAAVMSNINQGMINPRSEEAGAAIRQAFGFGLPGGNTDYYSAEKRREQGVSGKNNLQDVVGYAGKMAGGDKQTTALLMRNMFGTSLDINEKLIDAIKKGPSSSKEVEDLMKKAEPLEVQAAKATIELPEFLKHRAKIDDDLLEVGKKVAPLIEGLESLETNLLSQIINILQPMLTGLTTIVDWVNDKSGSQKVSDREKTQVATLEDQKKHFAEGVTSPSELFNQAAQMRAAGSSLIMPENREKREEYEEFGKKIQDIMTRTGMLKKNTLSDEDVKFLDIGNNISEDVARARAKTVWDQNSNKNAGSAAGPVNANQQAGQQNVSLTFKVSQGGKRIEQEHTAGTPRMPAVTSP